MLPDDLIPRTTQILLPRWLTPDERSAWLAQAFFISEPRLYNQLRDLDGLPIIILTRTITALLEAGCLPNKRAHSLAQLLKSVRIMAQPHEQAEIDKLVPLLDTACIESVKPATPATPVAVVPPTNPLQGYETPVAERTPTVFISYSHDDDDFTLRLIADLQRGGHAIWLDQMSIKGGSEWVRSIADGISNSYAFVSVVSPTANASRWVQREYLFADNLGKPIYPVMAVATDVPFQMIDKQIIMMHTDYADGLRELLVTLPAPQVYIPPAPIPPAAPAPQPAPSIPRPPSPIAPLPKPIERAREATDERAKKQDAPKPDESVLGRLVDGVRDLFAPPQRKVMPPPPAAPSGGEAAEFDLDDVLAEPEEPLTRAPISEAEAAEAVFGAKAASAPDRRALELTYISRVAIERLDAMSDMGTVNAEGEVRVLPMTAAGLTHDAAAWAQADGHAPEVGGEAALTLGRAMLMADTRRESMSAVWQAADKLNQRAKADPTQPIPLVLDMARWSVGQALDAFIAQEVGDLAAHLPALMGARRIALLIDHLSVLDAARHAEVERFLAAHPDLTAIVDLTPAE
jgi:hypothetical protein